MRSLRALAIFITTTLTVIACTGSGIAPSDADDLQPTEPARAASPTDTPPPSTTRTTRPTAAPTQPPALGSAPTGRTETARVLRVIDGDTIEVDRGRGPESVRYIGIDTPETVDPRRPVEWMGTEASDANRALVGGRDVVLEVDVSETDQFGRLLRYVWVSDGGDWLLVNLALVAAGFAQVSTFPPDVTYVDLYLAAQDEARTAERGLWGEPPATPKPTPAPAPTTDSNCDPSYPTVCIPRYPPDLDCGEISFRRFEVLPPDPHGFDGDRDGVGCESG